MQRNVFVPRRIGRINTHVENIQIPKNFKVITQIIAKNLKKRPPYGSCKIIAGGPSFNYVTFKFVSIINQPIQFILRLNGF